MDGFEQRAAVIRNGRYAMITVSATAPCENKVRRVGYPHVSRASATASAPARTVARGTIQGQCRNDISTDKQ